MEEGARPATLDDLEPIAALARTAIAELSTHKGGGVWARREARREPLEDSLRAGIEAADHLVLAGTIDGTVVGYLAAHTEALGDGSTLGVIDDIYTDGDARAVGVGEAMANGALEWCRSQGCIGVDSLALPGDRETKNFFESFGLVARAIIVHKAL